MTKWTTWVVYSDIKDWSYIMAQVGRLLGTIVMDTTVTELDYVVMDTDDA